MIAWTPQFIRVARKKHGILHLEVRFYDHVVAYRSYRDEETAFAAESLLRKDLAEAPNGDVVEVLKSWGEWVEPRINEFVRRMS